MKSTATLFFSLTLLIFSCSTSTSDHNGKYESLENPLGLTINESQINWQLPDSITQTSYQILVASNRAFLDKDYGDVWDSGREVSAMSEALVHWEQRAESELWWKVRVWDADGNVGPYGEPVRLANAFDPEATQRLVLLGGTMIAHMDDYPFFELDLTTRWPKSDLTFRNIGWPADDVFGLARSQFGSAQNTRSWQPPSAEEGFGSEVLKQHLRDADPDCVIIGYGNEMAWVKSDSEFEVFQKGYQDLIDYAKSLDANIVLLTPPKHEGHAGMDAGLEQRNEGLHKAAVFIRELAADKDLRCIDLHEHLQADFALTDNGYQLNEKGHQKLSEVMLAELGLEQVGPPALHFNEDGVPQATQGVALQAWKNTIKGIRFDLSRQSIVSETDYVLPSVDAVRVDGEAIDTERLKETLLRHDSIQYTRLNDAIIEKNKFYRYKIRPLNEAYIFLFRRHEMGHLAYEMQQFDELIAEEEDRIARLRQPQSRRIEMDLPRPWKSPRDYPEDEVPSTVPAPNISEELAAFTLSKGLDISLFAADPMIANPINMNWDHRGRAWVATSSTYPHILPGREPNDRIVILEDTDNDGVADTSIVFADGLLVPQSVMPVKGGAYVCATTELIFFADHDGDDRADEKQVIYDGFGNADVHHMIHGLRWAPWGDLFFTQSIYINTFVETPYGNRTLNGSGIWQFRPETQRLEVFSRGLINPWGHAFDRWGQAFGTDGAGQSGINYLYPGATHATAVGAERILQGLNKGTPKNTAAEAISSRHFPTAWQGNMITNDFRRNRTVRYALEDKGSSYKSEEVETIVHSSHRSYRPVDTKFGPDGAMYIVDWYNPIIDHGEVDFHHPIRDKSHGRIWRVTNRNKPILPKNLAANQSVSGLLNQLKSPEQLTRLQANRELVERGVTASQLEKWVTGLGSSSQADPHRLEALWLGVAINEPDQALLGRLLQSGNSDVRAASVRMVNYCSVADPVALLAPLIHDVHAQVRLEVVNAMRAINTRPAIELAIEAKQHAMDSDLNYMLWLTMRESQEQWLTPLSEGESIFADNLERITFALRAADNETAMKQMTRLVQEGNLSPDLRSQALDFLARSGDGPALDLVMQEIVSTEDASLLARMAAAPADHAARPSDASGLMALLQAEDSNLRTSAASLVGRWKVKGAEEALKAQLTSERSSAGERLSAAKALGDLENFGVLSAAAKSSENMEVRAIAASVWADSKPEEAVATAVDVLSKLEESNSAQTLYRSYLAQEEGPQVLAASIRGETIPTDIAVAGLQLCRAAGRDFSQLIEALEESGSVASVGADLTAEQKEALLKEVVEKGDANRGRQIYRKPKLQCGVCHHMAGVGGKLGPDLTTVGSYMTPGSILESLLNPGKDIKQGYETILITRKDGSIVGGILDRKTDSATLLKDATNKVISVPSSDIEKMDVSPISLMPAGLTASLRPDELRDLLAFLTSLGKNG